MLFGLSPQKITRTLAYVIALIFILLPFHELLVVWAGSNTGHMDAWRIWKEILICLAFVPALWLVAQDEALKKWLFKSWIARLYLIYIFLHLFLGIWAIKHNQLNANAFIYALIVNLRFIGFFILCALIAARDDFLKRYWAKLVLIPAGLAIVFGLLQRFILPYDFLKHFGYGPKTIPAYETIDNNIHYRRIQSSLRGANPLGAYLVLVITAAAADMKHKNLKPVYLLAATITLFLSYSRSAWIGALLSLGVLAWLVSKKLGMRLTYVGAAIVVIVATGLFLFRGHQSVQDALLHTSQNSTSSISSNQARSSAISSALKDVEHKPFGTGPGTAGPASFRNVEPPRISENYYLQLAQEVGLIGLGVFLVINYLVVLELWRTRADMLSRVLLASFVGITFINLLSHAWADDTLSLLWWGLAGVACAPILMGRKNRESNAQKET